MNEKEQKDAIKMVKKEFQLEYLRPLYYNTVRNKGGLLQICIYKNGSSLERELVSTNGWNARVLANRWHNGDKSCVIYGILNEGNDARDRTEVGYCLIEVIDANVLTKDEFLELFKVCAKKSKENNDLYSEIKRAMLKVITKNKKNLNAWSRISGGFKDRIELEIWQGDLQPYCIEHGEISQVATMREALKEIVEIQGQKLLSK